MAKIVQNKSKAYGYNYSSLSDLAKADIEIPVMRTTVNEFGEFVEWLDDKGNWQQGARVIQMEMKGMNAAQAYGSALTYARRYTVQMAKQIVCDDDKALETQSPQAYKPTRAKLNFEEIEEKFKSFTDIDELRKYYATISNGATEKQKECLAKKATFWANQLKKKSDEPSDKDLEEAGL